MVFIIAAHGHRNVIVINPYNKAGFRLYHAIRSVTSDILPKGCEMRDTFQRDPLATSTWEECCGWQFCGRHRCVTWMIRWWLALPHLIHHNPGQYICTSNWGWLPAWLAGKEIMCVGYSVQNSMTLILHLLQWAYYQGKYSSKVVWNITLISESCYKVLEAYTLILLLQNKKVSSLTWRLRVVEGVWNANVHQQLSAVVTHSKG